MLSGIYPTESELTNLLFKKSEHFTLFSNNEYCTLVHAQIINQVLDHLVK